MQPRVSVQVNPADIARAQVLLRAIPNGADRAQTRALNNTAKKARTRMISEARKDINLLVAFLRDRIFGPDQKPSNKATFTRKAAKVTAERRGLLLSHFMRRNRTSLQDIGGRLRAKVEVKVKATGRYIAMPSAFLLRLRRGTESGDQYGIFLRTDGTLKHLYGPSPSQIFNQEIPTHSRSLQALLEQQTDQEVTTLLRRSRA